MNLIYFFSIAEQNEVGAICMHDVHLKTVCEGV